VIAGWTKVRAPARTIHVVVACTSSAATVVMGADGSVFAVGLIVDEVDDDMADDADDIALDKAAELGGAD
jgi:hypothetical protein